MGAGDDRNDDGGPLLGALLRICHQAIAARLVGRFSADGLAPLQPAVTQPLWDAPWGLRVTQLANNAGMTKQSMGELVDQMEAAGYVERIADSSDGRARLVRLTKKGRRAGRLAREVVREIRAEWSAQLGAARMAALEKTLQAIVKSLSG